MCCLKYEQNAYEDAVKRMPKVESFVQTPDGPGNVKSIDLLRETVKVSLDSSPESLKKYHNCEVRVLRNGKGSRDGIEIPDRPARYVEEKEEDLFEMPVISSSFFTDPELEDAPIREKIGGAESGEGGKSRRRHRGGRRRHKNGQTKAAEQVTEKTEKPEKSEKSEKKTDRKPEKKQEKKPERKPEKKGEKKEPKASGQQSQPKAEKKPEGPAAEGGEAVKRRRPHHRGGRRRHKSGGEGGTPKAE
jgi:hypothetical protein